MDDLFIFTVGFLAGYLASWTLTVIAFCYDDHNDIKPGE